MANLFRSLITAMACADFTPLLPVNDSAQASVLQFLYCGLVPGLLFALIVLGPELGWRPRMLLGAVLAYALNMAAIFGLMNVRISSAYLPGWVNPISLVGSCGLAVVLLQAKALSRWDAVGLALLGTLLGYLSSLGLRSYEGHEAFQTALGAWAWQGPVALYLHWRKRRGA
jgi:hypothetical protein